MQNNHTKDSLDNDENGEDSSSSSRFHTSRSSKKQRRGNNEQSTFYIATYDEDDRNSVSGSNSIVGTDENFFNANSRPKGSGRQVNASSEESGKNHFQRLAKAATDSLFTSEDIKYSTTLFLSTFVSFLCIA